MPSDHADPSVACVVVPLPPTYRGGTEEYAYQLVRRFASTLPVQVYTTRVRYTPELGSLPVGDAQVDLLPARELLERPVLTARSARRRLLGAVARAGVVQLHMPFPLVESPVMHAARAAGVPAVLTYHMDADLGGASHMPGAGLVTWGYRRTSAHPALDQCDVVVSNSRGYAEASPVLSRHLAKVRVIPKGVDLDRLGLADRTPRHERPSLLPVEWFPAGRKAVLFVGRLVPYKGLTGLLSAVEQLLTDRVDLTLLIAGRGPLESTLRSEVEAKRLSDRVRFLGFVPDTALGAIYQYADVVTCPSIGRLESTATALEEAAALGTKVVGTDLPGTSETVPNDGRRGLLVPPGNVSALAHALRRMIEEPRPEPPEKFRSWADTAADYLKLFRELGARIPDPGAPMETSAN